MYVTSILLVFALVVGAAFMYFFTRLNETAKKETLRERSVRIAEVLAENYTRMQAFDKIVARPNQEIDDNEKNNIKGQGNNQKQIQNMQRNRPPIPGIGGPRELPPDAMEGNFNGPRQPIPKMSGSREYATLNLAVRFFNSRPEDTVWLIDAHKNVFQPPKPGARDAAEILFSQLPEESKEAISEAFKGKVFVGENFTKLLKRPTLTAAAPVKLEDGTINGVVLIHSPIVGMDMIAWNVIKLLIVCVVVGFILVFILGAILSLRFIEPLKRMTNNAELMAQGDYSVRSNLAQEDEIGKLGGALDILGEKLEIARRESEKLEQLRREFVANISHELRTPVTVIRASLEALVDKIIEKPEDIDRYNNKMLSETIFLQRLINDLLDLSRLQNSNFVIEKETLNFADILDDVVYAAKRIGEKKNVKVIAQFDKKEFNPFLIKGDYGRLRQMLMVYIDNAVKFSDEGSHIDILFNGDELKITDYGIGIKEEELEHVFEKFYKTRGEKNKSGTGLGLAISREIAERHSLKVSMKSKFGEGSTVIISGFKSLKEKTAETKEA
jgi:signal transduction histidine kinase